MTIKLTSIALVVGLSLGLGPWIFIEKPESYWIWISMFGAVLVSIAGYNAQAGMIGLGEPGEELLQSCWAWVKKWLKKR